MQSLADAVNIAEDISILFLLHQVVELPTSNAVIPPKGHRPTEYSLPFEKERDLTIILAYISCIRDNPNRVPALCIRENKASNQLDILFAVNASNAADKGVLPEVQTRFQELFKLLSSVPTCKPLRGEEFCLKSPLTFPADMMLPFWLADNAEKDIFAEIVSMCTTRILEPTQETHLLDAIRILSQKSPTFADAAKDLVHKINLWNKHQTTSELIKVVESAHHLSKILDLATLLDHISNKDMSPTARSGLLNAIKKLARYRTAARILYRAAKKFPIVQKMNFIPVNLPEVAFQKVPATMQAPGRRISEALSRTTLSKRERKRMNICYGCLKTDQETANKRFRDQKMQTLGESKIHAEVQLVFFCETNDFQPPPRVISSSKDACFLCNALIKVHGKYHIPRQHGRLYPGWRLPWFPAPNSIQSKLAKHLEEVISGSIKTMIQSQKRINHPPPNESTALTVAMSETTASLNGSCPSTSSRSSSPAEAEVLQPVPLHEPGEVGASAVRLPTPGSPSLSIANVAKAQRELASEPQKVVDQGEHGKEGNSVLRGKAKEVADQGGENGKLMLSGKAEEAAYQEGKKVKTALPVNLEGGADQGREEGKLVSPENPPKVGDEGGEGKAVAPPGKPPKVPPRPPPKEPPRVFSQRWANLSSPTPNRLVQGKPQVVNVEANTSSRFYKGGSVGLEIEYSTTGPAEKRAARDLSCNLEWLATADAEAVRADKEALIIHAEKLEAEIPIPSSALGKWYIVSKDMMIRVQIE
ncbi:unnamed protein product [Clonostachys rhizophaga]|uniref:Uncharacterized protein n=1 Tax=Clonostachys rhizophaga TaxID=160324 RepID=A0A9N9V7K1_9HYPO|nr:unnamed protein product [Clonostachys rhizophaga]